MKKLILLSATLGALHLSNTTYAQIQSIKFDPVGNYLGVLFPVSHPLPISSSSPVVVSAYFKFDITLDSTGVRTGTGIGNVFVSGKRTTFTLASFVAPTLTSVGGNPVLNMNGSIDFYLNWKMNMESGADGDTSFTVVGTLTKVPSSTTSIYFRKVTHKDAAATLSAFEKQGMLSGSTVSPCTVEASGGKANLALDRVKIKRSRAGSSKSFFKS